MWRGGRAVDGSGLENRHTRKGIGGSNPSLSASIACSRRSLVARRNSELEHREYDSHRTAYTVMILPEQFISVRYESQIIENAESSVHAHPCYARQGKTRPQCAA